MGDTGTGGDLTPEAAAVERARAYAERRRTATRRPDPSAARRPSIPVQPSPTHEQLVEPARAEMPLQVTRSAHGIESARSHVVAGLLLAGSAAGAVTCLVLTVLTRSVGAVVGLVMCAFLAVLCRGAMMAAGRATDGRGVDPDDHRVDPLEVQPVVEYYRLRRRGRSGAGAPRPGRTPGRRPW